MVLGQFYFFTATISGWRKLLAPDKYKAVITNSLAYLAKQGKIAVYGFVVMPNHIHLLWELLEPNGKELPHTSFLKYTSHQIQIDLRQFHPQILELFRVDTETRAYQFWQRDSLAIQVYTPDVIYQKLDYIHNNPCQGKWLLAKSPAGYPYSSANFYKSGDDAFSFLTHIGERV